MEMVLKDGRPSARMLQLREQSSTKSIQTSDAPPCVDVRIYIINICICISSFKIYVIHMRDIKFSEGIYIYREKEKGRQRDRDRNRRRSKIIHGRFSKSVNLGEG